MLEAQGIGYRLPEGKWLWRNLDLELKPGSIIGVIGRNGSGKTTLLRSMLSLVKPHEGSIFRKGASGYVPQQTEITLSFSVGEVVAMGRARHVRLFTSLSRKDRQMIDWAMECTGITELADRSFHTLSGGERQLVLIARAVAAECDALLLDEPFTGLDLDNQRHTLSLIKSLANQHGLGVLFTAHHPDHLFAAANEALVLRKGKEALRGPAKTYLTSGLLSRIYGVDIQIIDVAVGQKISRHAVPNLET